jgi:hypothetical protein
VLGSGGDRGWALGEDVGVDSHKCIKINDLPNLTLHVKKQTPLHITQRHNRKATQRSLFIVVA